MGKISKRSKIIPLTKVKPKGRALKLRLIQKVQDLLQKFPLVFVFQYANFKTDPLRILRQDLTDSKFLLGKAKILQKAINSDKNRINLQGLSTHLKGQCGLFFTRKHPQEVLEYFCNWSEMTLLRTGQIASQDIVVPVGKGNFRHLSNTAQPYLRKLGLVTRVDMGEIEVLREFVACRQGDQVTNEQARVCKLLNVKQGEMRILMKGYWMDGEYYSVNQ